MSTLFDEIQELQAQYPDPRSAVLPALQLAQARHGGWLPEEAFREVADGARDDAGVLPLDRVVLRHVPARADRTVLCRGLHERLVRRQRRRRRSSRRSRASSASTPGETSADGAFTLRTVECLGGCGWATVVAVNNRHRLHVKAEDVPEIVEELRRG